MTGWTKRIRVHIQRFRFTCRSQRSEALSVPTHHLRPERTSGKGQPAAVSLAVVCNSILSPVGELHRWGWSAVHRVWVLRSENEGIGESVSAPYVNCVDERVWWRVRFVPVDTVNDTVTVRSADVRCSWRAVTSKRVGRGHVDRQWTTNASFGRTVFPHKYTRTVTSIAIRRMGSVTTTVARQYGITIARSTVIAAEADTSTVLAVWRDRSKFRFGVRRKTRRTHVRKRRVRQSAFPLRSLRVPSLECYADGWDIEISIARKTCPPALVYWKVRDTKIRLDANYKSYNM
jgi:hypothetical protein